MPQPILQNGLHQTCSCTRPTMQPQTSYHRLVERSKSHMLLQTLAEIQDSSSQPIRPTLGFSRIPPSLATPSWPFSHRWRILTEQGIPIQKENHTQLQCGLHSWTKRNGLPSMPNQHISDLCHKMWTEYSKNVPLLPGHWQHLPRSVHLRTSFSRSSDDCHISCRPPATTTTQQVISMGRRSRTTTPSGVHSGQTKEGVPKWATHHLFCWFSFSPYAQHPGQNDLSTYPSGLSKPLCLWGCLHTSWDPSICASRRQFNLDQSRSSWILHQHWSRPLHWSLVHAPGLPPTQNGCLRPRGLLNLSGKSNNPGDIIKGRTFRRLNVTRKITIKDVPGLQHGTQHANVCLGPALHSSMPR